MTRESASPKNTEAPLAITTRQSAKSLVRPAIASAVYFMLVTGVGYPLVTTAVASVIFHDQANGSVITRNAQGVGSSVIGQEFTRPEYFHGRPSVTTGPDPADSSRSVDRPYNAMSSAASNHGTTSRVLINNVSARAERYREINGLSGDTRVPVDAVTASASGLDPHISLANALLQVDRVARARRVSPEYLQALVRRSVESRQLGVLGDPRVNVLRLNIALDSAIRVTRSSESSERP